MSAAETVGACFMGGVTLPTVWRGGSAVRTSACQSRGFESTCCRFEAWAILFTLMICLFDAFGPFYAVPAEVNSFPYYIGCIVPMVDNQDSVICI